MKTYLQNILSKLGLQNEEKLTSEIAVLCANPCLWIRRSVIAIRIHRPLESGADRDTAGPYECNLFLNLFSD